MPKVGMEPIRKQQLIDATIASIHARGYADTTIKQISREAGVSPGIVHHYFDNKDDLLQATMRKLMEDLRLIVLDHLKAATTPRQRIEALIEAYLCAHLFAPETVSAWLAFWAHVPHSSRLQRLQRIFEARQTSAFLHALKNLLPEAQAERAAHALVALIDGLWVRASLQRNPLSREDAREIVLDYLDMLLNRYGWPGQKTAALQ